MMVDSSFPSKNGFITVGSIKLNSDGSGTAAFDTGFPQGTTWAFTFCPFPSPAYRGCPALTTVQGDGSSNPVSFPFHMPQKGTFAGVFVIENPNFAFYDSGFLFPATGDQYLSPLVRASTVSGGIGNVVVGSEPLSSGQVTMNNSSAAHVVVQGAQPNTTYGVTYCFVTDGSSCFQVGSLTTDASGNGATDISDSAGSQTFEGVYHLDDASGVQYITGFTLH